MQSTSIYEFRSLETKSPVVVFPYAFSEKLMEIYLKDTKNFKMNLFSGENDSMAFEKTSGRNFLDVLMTQGITYLLSNKTCDILQKENLQGWAAHACNIVDGKGALLSNEYQRLVITASVGKFSPDLNNIIEQDLSFLNFIGGEIQNLPEHVPDFFMSEDTNSIFVTQKVVDVFKYHKITNAEFVPMREMLTIWRRTHYNIAMGYNIHKGMDR